MKTYCLKFPDKATAHAALYDKDRSPLYDNVVDYNGAGITTQRKTDASGNQYLTWPDDGSYHADMRCEALPPQLEDFVIFPDPRYRKHTFLGE